MKRLLLLTIAIVASIPVVVTAQTEVLKHKIEQVIKAGKADVGAAIYDLETGESVQVNGDKYYPMQSVFKFHIALCMLHEIDKGTFKLDQKIFIKKESLIPNTWSPLRDAHPNGNVYLPLSEILTYTVSQSDNIGCDMLLELLGGTKKVNDYIHQAGVPNVFIEVNEAEMHKDWNAQFKNRTTPLAANELLKKFHNQKLLSATSYAFLAKIMAGTTTGKDRIRGLLPKDTQVQHKTGTSDTSPEGITAAINDIGIVSLSNGKHLFISVFVANSKETPAAMEKIIADISKLAWDYFKNK
jgi:beta-lactamase class A